MMKRYFIEDAKCGVTDGGMACGPIDGSVVVTIQFNDGEKTQWLSNAEVTGIPNVYLCDKDVHDELVKEDFDNEEFGEYMNDHFISDFNGIAFGEDYYETFSSIAEDPENPAIPLVRYLITLTRCPMDEVEGLIAMAKGHYADELEIPMSDSEEEYLEDQEENEEE